MIGLYTHIPFCHARCGYCDFVTFTGKEDRIDAYVNALTRELVLYKDLTDQRPFETVFFGGGTPSLLEERHLVQFFSTLREHYRLAPIAEVTLEANPESVTAEKARAWRAVGINRVSMGLQAMDDALLKTMGRLHNVEQFLEAYRILRETGFENLSLDLIYGFEGQSQESWRDTVTRAARLSPEHISMYALTVEEHTPFAAAGVKTNTDVQAEMYEWARQALAGFGYGQYEISNFSRSGRECRHNLIYWRQQDYLGVGVGAVGVLGSSRWQNQKTLHEYHYDIGQGRLPRASVELLDPHTRKFENLMLGLRLREGFDWRGETNVEWLARRAELKAKGWLEEVRPGQWRIPDSYVGLTNQILLPFL